jgi:hypothetical protein
VTVCRVTAASPYGASGSSRVRRSWTGLTTSVDTTISRSTTITTWLSRTSPPLRCCARFAGCPRPCAPALLGAPAPEYPRLVMSREATPRSAGGIEARILRSAEWAVYDFDDAMWADRRGDIHRVLPKPTKWRRGVEAADCVIAGNDYLANAAQSLNRNVVIPSCVEPADYPKKGNYELPERRTFVWLGPASAEIHLSEIAPPLLELNRRRGRS